MTNLPIPLQKGLHFASIDGVRFVGAPSYFDHKFAKDKWVFEVELSLVLGSSKQVVTFPRLSRWFMVVDFNYPYGNIDIYPAKDGGIKETFHHQSLNNDIFIDLPWRMGKICLDKPIQSLGNVAGRNDPVGDYEERLRWYLQRAVDWIHAAATDSLIKIGDPFETPYYLFQDHIKHVHDESVDSFSTWSSIRPGDWGYVILDSLKGINDTEFIVAYFTRDGNLIRFAPNYNETIHILGIPEIKQGLWWLWPKPVVLHPWQAPTNWGELRKAGKLMGINVDNCLQNMNKALHGKEATELYIGYPIPKKYGEPFSEIHWQAIMMPKMLPRTEGSNKPPHGFRTFARWQWWLERTRLLSDYEQLNYLETVNWHPDRLQARGRLLRSLRDAKVILIGCGALGSIVAELLVRGGLREILFIDPQILEAGNLVRHTLAGQDIGKWKAEALAKRLSSSAPFTNIRFNTSRFPTEHYEVISLIEDYDVVVDCTADDEVIHCLSLGFWEMEKLFISSSVGYKARRTFLFTHRGLEFPFNIYQSLIEPLLQEERTAWIDDGETIEGAGCWSPLFPARMDDLMLAASSTIKVLEEMMGTQESGTRLVIFEEVSEGSFQGLKRSDVTPSQSSSR